MRRILTFGQIGMAVTISIPLFYLSFFDNSFLKSRKYKVEYEFNGLEGDGKERYQGMPKERVCMGKNKNFESVYDIRLKSGTQLEATGYKASGSIKIKEPFSVIEKKSYVVDGAYKGREEAAFSQLNGEIKENLRLIIYKDEEGRFGAILVGRVADMWGKEYGIDNLNDVDENDLATFAEHIKTGNFAVRRSVKGVWSNLHENSCNPSQIRKAYPLYKNYGVLVEKWSEETINQKLQEYEKGIFKGTIVLDWIDFGFKNIEQKQGAWMNSSEIQQGTTLPNAIGRWDYWKLHAPQPEKARTLKVIVGKLQDIEIDAEGIGNGRGDKIKWSEKFKPTKWEVSLTK